jgi:large subunit ribosomal protein L5
MNRLQVWNKNIVYSDLVYKLNPENLNGMIHLDDIVLKSTINTSVNEPKDIIFGLVGLELLTNQKAKVSRTRKSIAAFKTRKFIPISSKVTIRKSKLYSHLDFLINVAFPKWTQLKELDKRSLVSSKESLSLGLSSLTMFPQLTKEYEQLPNDMGVTITMNTRNSHNEYELLLLLSEFQMPVIV